MFCKVIARIQTPHRNIRSNIEMLLHSVGKSHPQALIYPLTVASKSSSNTRRKAALRIMEFLQKDSPRVVEQVSVTLQQVDPSLIFSIGSNCQQGAD
jgi:serine/threonine-protein kinase mTOR